MFWAHAISHQEGGEADGIHLLWAPPRFAGYSVGGFDIWRRESRQQGEPTCYDLTPGNLTALRTGLRADTPPALISVRVGPCPAPPASIPDEPYSDSPPRGGCLDIVPKRLRHRLAPRGELDEHVLTALREANPAAETWGALLKKGAASAAANLLRVAGEHDPVGLALNRAVAIQAESADSGSRSAPTHNVPAVAAPPGITVFPGVATQCLVYEFRLREPCNLLQLRFSPYGGLAVAFRDAKALEARAMTQGGANAEVEFHHEAMDRVVVWVAVAPRAISICCRSRRDEESEDWEDAKLIASNLQFPLREIEPTVTDLAGEQALAESRLLAGEGLGPGQFRDLSDAMNEALQRPSTSPVYLSRMARSTEDQDYIEVQPWATGLAMSIDAPWRRALGLGFLDQGKGLTAGAVYDYRIVGRFRRRDVEERLLGFHTVPLGTPLPRVLYLGALRLDFGGDREVVPHPKIPDGGLGHEFRKGVHLQGRTTLAFAAPVERVVLELEPGTVGLHFRALSGGVIPGLTMEVASDVVPAAARVELAFPSHVTRLELDGEALLYGVRLRLVPESVDPEEVIELDAIVPGVLYEPTAAPNPPPLLGTVNLQAPLLTGDPAITTRQPPTLIGFKLWWLPPPSAGNWPSGWWPLDLPAAQPMDVVGFDIERRRVDTGEPWEPFDVDPETRLGTLVGAARSSRRDPEPLRPGDDLLEHFPEIKLPMPPVPVFADLEDVLLSRAKPEGPPPGSLHQYRIRSVDPIGRHSTTATVGSLVRLEKRLPPPRTPGPPIPADETGPLPRGVRARLLQAADPALSAEDRAKLDGRANAVLLEWGWTDEERNADSWAREFRLYWQPRPPDMIEGEFSGGATLVAGLYELSASLSHSVSDDQFAGEFVRAGDYPFRIAHHGAGAAGSSVLVRLEPSTLAVTPAPVPAAGHFRLRPALAGEELQPGSWQERTDVIPIDARTHYEYVFPHTLTIDPDHSRVRVWAGVSAADDQPYIVDAIPAATTHGGRPGNESSIVAAIAEGRWLGRPTLNVPPPLPQVPEVMIPEVPGEEVTHSIDLPAFLPGLPHPGGIRFRLERLSGADLAATLSAHADDSIRVALPDGSSVDYALANPGDRAALLTQIRSGEPARVENRFLTDIAIQFSQTALANLWQLALPPAVSFGVSSDQVPNKAERYLYRVKSVDAAGHVSEGAALVPRMFRVPSRRLPAVPQLLRVLPAQDRAQAVVRTGARFDLAGVLLFWLVEDTAVADPTRLDKPQLLRVPGRPDLYPSDGIRLRLSDGTLVEPEFAATVAAAAAGTVLTWTVEHLSGYDQRVTAWSATVTRDGMPSLVVGPLSTSTGYAPPEVPALAVAIGVGIDQASWPAPAVDVSLRLERSLDGGATWQPVSPWIPPSVNEHSIAVGPTGRVYRLRARHGQQETVGAALPPS